MTRYPELLSPNSAKCETELPFIDDRGTIQPIVDAPIGGCAFLTSRKGAVRANHYHQEDWHYTYVVTGSLAYYHRPVGSKETPKREVFTAGDVFHSAPLMEHAMEFLEDSSIIVLSKMHRDHDTYEEDVVRVSDLTKA